MPLRCLWAGWTCRRPVRRMLCHVGMPLRCLWAGSPCQSADRCPLCHAMMPLRYLWARSPCRRPVKRPLCHTITCIRWAPPASRALGSARLSESSAVRCPRPSIFVLLSDTPTPPRDNALLPRSVSVEPLRFLIKDFLPPSYSSVRPV